MNEKTGKILEIIAKSKNLTKLDIKNASGYSMTTVLKNVEMLEKEGYISCHTRAVKSGKPPSVINVTEDGVIVIVDEYGSQCSITFSSLKGKILYRAPLYKPFSSSDILSTIKEYSTKKPLLLYILSDKATKENKDFKTLGCEFIIEEYLTATLRFFREMLGQNNLSVITLGEKILYANSLNRERIIDIGTLPTSIINENKGRLSVKDVLSYNSYTANNKKSKDKCFAVALKDIINYISFLSLSDKIILLKEQEDKRLELLKEKALFQVHDMPDTKEVAFKTAFLSLFGK